MKSYIELIQEELIDFKKLLLEKYYLINITETECLVLLRLYEYSKTKNNNLNINEICQKMSLDKDELSNIIAGLVSKGFITLKISDEESDSFLEEFSLEDTFKELAYAIDSEEKKVDKDNLSEKVKTILRLLEKKNNKLLSPFEMELVRKWIYEYQYDMDIIKEEIEKTFKTRNPSVSLVDRNLYAKTRESISSDDVETAQEILKRIYGKK